MTAQQYKQKLAAKWSSIQDDYTRQLVAELLAYAQQLEDAKANLSGPGNLKYPVSPRDDGDSGSRTFRQNIDPSFLLDDAPVDGQESAGTLVGQLLEYAETLEKQIG